MLPEENVGAWILYSYHEKWYTSDILHIKYLAKEVSSSRSNVISLPIYSSLIKVINMQYPVRLLNPEMLTDKDFTYYDFSTDTVKCCALVRFWHNIILSVKIQTLTYITHIMRTCFRAFYTSLSSVSTLLWYQTEIKTLHLGYGIFPSCAGQTHHIIRLWLSFYTKRKKTENWWNLKNQKSILFVKLFVFLFVFGLY